MRRSFLAIASQYKTSLLKLYKILLSTRTGMLSYYVILFTRLTLTFLNCTVLVHYELHRESVPWLVSSIPTTTKTKRWWCLLVYSVEDCSCVLIRGRVYGSSIVVISVLVCVCVCVCMGVCERVCVRVKTRRDGSLQDPHPRCRTPMKTKGTTSTEPTTCFNLRVLCGRSATTTYPQHPQP